MARTKGGSKVPNVKLRPAQLQKKPTEGNLFVPGSLDPKSQPFDQRALLEGSKPLRKAQISSTGISEKKELFTKARRMGAEASSSLMTFSTHLLALEPEYDNEKYKAAWQAGMHIVKPSWLNEIYERWRLAETIDVTESMESHYVGPFSGLCLSLTGPTDPVVRESFRRTVLQGGGTTMKGLNFSCTHLVCFAKDSEKIRWVQRQDPKSRDLKKQPPRMVWEEWLWDSFAAGRKLEESQYSLSKPRPKRKYRDVVKQPWPPKEEIGTSYEPSTSTQTPLPAPIPVAPLTDELEMPAMAKRLKNAGRKEWECIIQRRAPPGLSQDGSRRLASPLKGQDPLSPGRLNATPGWRQRSPSRQKQTFLPTESAQPANGNTTADSSSPRKVSAIRLPTEGEPAALTEPELIAGKRTEKPEPWNFLRRIDRANAFTKPESIPPSKYQVKKNEDLDVPMSAIFTGMRLRAFGEANCAALRQELERAGAALINRNGAEVDFYVVRLAGGAEQMKKEAPQDEHHKFRTECWVERCIFESRICDVDENVTFQPLKVPTPLADASQMFVASSGLDLSEQTWVKRLLRVLGMNWSPAFSKTCTHLLCPSKQGPKYDRAREWNILIVDLEWLRDIAISGRIPPLLSTSFADITNAFTDRSSQSQVLSISPLNTGGLPEHSVSMNGEPSPSTRLFAPSLPYPLDFNPPLNSTAIFGDPAAFLLPPSVAGLPTEERQQRTQSPTTPSPSRRNLPATANSSLSPSKDRVPSSVSPEPLKFPQLRPEGLDPEKMKGLAGNIGALLLGSKRRADDDGNEGDLFASSESIGGSGSRKRPRRPISRAKTVSDATSTPPRMQPQTFFADADNMEESQTSLDDRNAGGVSCGVHYDDPSSRAEKKRLMSLLNGEDESQVTSETLVTLSTVASVEKAAAPKRTTAGRRRKRMSGF